MATATARQQKDETINLFEVGCLVNLRIRMWSGRKMLTNQDLISLGYDPKNLPEDIVNLGRKLMVPKTELQALTQIEQRARKALERWSVPFGIANAHFVPATMLPTVQEQIRELKEEFFSRVDSFISRFDEMKEKVKADHPDFWEKCLKNHYPANPKALRERFQFDWYTFKIAGLGSIEEADVNEIIAKQKIQDERVQELRTGMKNEVGRFVEEYVGSMRQETVKFCNLMEARIKGKPFGDETDAKKLTPKSIACFRKFVERFQNMNIFGDGEVQTMLEKFRNDFLDSGVGPKDFESANVQNGVSKALEAIRQKAAMEGDNAGQFVDELKRKVVL